MDTARDFMKTFSSSLQPYGYNVALCTQDIKEQSSRIEKTQEGNRHALLERIPSVGSIIQSRREVKLERQKEQWQQSFQAPYPYIRDKMGKEHHFEDFLKQAEQWKNDLVGQKDGWYHLPETVGGVQIPDKDRKAFDALCKERGMYLPYAVGKVLEQQFSDAYLAGEQIWIHRTGLSQESSLLADIAKHGLIVPAQGHGEQERHELSYTATRLNQNHFPFMIQTVMFDTYKNCKGVILCRTGLEPHCENGRLCPSQILGFAAKDENGVVGRFLSREDMEEIRDQKMILDHGKEVSVDRKPQAELTAEDYRHISLSSSGKTAILLTDSYDRDPNRVSVIYGGVIYGNIEMAAREIPLSAQETKVLNEAAEQLCQKETEYEYGCEEDFCPVSTLDQNGQLIREEETEMLSEKRQQETVLEIETER